MLYTRPYVLFPGYRLLRDRERLPVGLLLLGLPAAVRGSEKAERAARRAIAFRFLEVAAAAGAAGLLLGSVFSYPAASSGLPEGWPDLVPTWGGTASVSTALTWGFIASFVLQLALGRAARRTSTKSIVLYNRDCMDETRPNPPDCRRMP